MCGIFGIVSKHNVNIDDLRALATHAEQRGRDSSGLVVASSKAYLVQRADTDIVRLLKKVKIGETTMAMGHSRLITNGLSDMSVVK